MMLEVRDLRVSFRTEHGLVRAVDGVSFDVAEGEILGVVGESGSGKTLSLLAVMGLINDPNAVIEGSISYRGRELVGLPQREMRKLRGPRDRHDLPGSDDGADAGLHDRLADRRADPGA